MPKQPTPPQGGYSPNDDPLLSPFRDPAPRLPAPEGPSSDRFYKNAGDRLRRNWSEKGGQR